MAKYFNATVFRTLLFAPLFAALFAIVACGPTTSQLKDSLEKDPEPLINAIKKHPKVFLDALNEAAMEARKLQMEDREKEEKNALDEDFKTPKVPEGIENRILAGPKDAPITIVEYSDFQCPFCSRAMVVIKRVQDKYPGKIKFVYKHLPFKPMAEPAARYFEAIRAQDPAKAKKFHDELYTNQVKIQEGEAYLKAAAKKVGADLKKVADTINSEVITNLINSDRAEAEKFGFQGTPGFLVNGVRVHGALPEEHFAMLIDRHLGKAQ